MHDKAVSIGLKRVNRRIRFILPAVVLAGLLVAGRAVAMDRFAALSMIESGDDDFARGHDAEVSRFQIRREVWLQATNLPISQATNAVVALAVAQAIAGERCQTFARQHGRPATDFEFYVLWNSPEQVNHPAPAVRERAARFENLVQQK
jgi:hypothetical protein